MAKESVVVIFSLKDERGALRRALKAFDDLDINLSHIESRHSKTRPDQECDIYAQFSCTSEKKTAKLISELGCYATNVRILQDESKALEQGDSPWFPKSIHELHRCCTNLFKYGHELTPDHPGFGDEAYVERRKHIAKVAQEYA